MKTKRPILSLVLLLLILPSIQARLTGENNYQPLHDHFFVEIDDVISDDGLRKYIDGSGEYLELDANGFASIPFELKLNIWHTSHEASIQVSPSIGIQLMLENITLGENLNAYISENSNSPIIYEPGSTVAEVTNFELAIDPKTKSAFTKMVNNTVYYKYTVNLNAFILAFQAKRSHEYQVSLTLQNYPENDDISLLSHTQSFKVKIGKPDLAIRIFPNPNQGVFQFHYTLPYEPQFEQFQVRIFDAKGQLIKAFSEGAQKEGKLKLNLNGFGKGIYRLQLNYGGEQITKIIQKQ